MFVAQLRKSFKRPIGEYAGADIFMSRPMMALTVAPKKCAGNVVKNEEIHAKIHYENAQRFLPSSNF